MMYSKALLSLFFVAFGVASVNGKVCEGKNVFESTSLTLPSGHVVTMERFNCTNSAPISAERRAANVLERRHSFEVNLDRKSATQCTASNCQCGVPCVFGACRPVTQTIQAAHCQQLAAQLQNTPGTFTIPANEGVGFILQSCEYTAFIASATQAGQYCFDDMGVAAAELFAICGTQQGDCEGNNSAFFVDQISL